MLKKKSHNGSMPVINIKHSINAFIGITTNISLEIIYCYSEMSIEKH